MKKIYLALFSATLMTANAQYVNTLHNSPGSFFFAHHAIPLSAGGFVVKYEEMASNKASFVKLNSSGNVVWNKAYDFAGSGYQCNSICENSAGDFLALGNSNTALIIQKYDANGNPVLYDVRNVFYGTGGSMTGPIVESDGTGMVFMAASASNSDTLVFGSINSAGTIQWLSTISYGGLLSPSAIGSSGYAKAMAKTSAGDFVGLFEFGSSGPYTQNLGLIKFTNTGTVVFTKSLQMSGSITQLYANDVSIAANGDILVSGGAQVSGQYGAYVMRLDASGNTIWSNFYQNGCASSLITEMPNGDLMLGISSQTLTPDNVDKSAFISLSSTGTFKWCRTFNSIQSNQVFSVASMGGGFAGAVFYTSGYTSPGGIGMITVDGNGEIMGCHDIIPSIPTATFTPTFSSFVAPQNPISNSLGGPSPQNAVNGLAFNQMALDYTVTGSVSNPLCYGGFGNVTLSASGGYTGYNYEWSNGTSNQNLLNVLAGTYYSRVADAKGCVLIDTFTVVTPAQLSATSAVTNVTCFGSQNGAIDITPTGGTAGYTYQWATLDTTQDLSGLSGGFYQLIITDANACTKTIGIAVQEPTQLISAINASSNVTCTGMCNGSLGGIVSGGTGPYTYSWNVPGGSTSISVSGLCPGNYLFTVTDSKGCVSFSNGIITEPNPLAVSTSTMGSVCGMNDGWAVAGASGGVQPYSYSWSNGALNDTASSLAAGVYSVMITDNNLCTATQTVSIGTETVGEDVCIVTVDSTNHNVIVWEKATTGNVAGYNIYRNIVGAYSLIGYQPYDSLSEYIDMTFGVDPAITSYRYEIAAVDTCGNTSALSSYHQTIHLTSSLGVGGEVNLVWDNYQGLPFSYNRILRDSTGNGNWQVVDSVSSTNFTWTDLTPPDSVRYLIEIISPSSCTSTRALVNTSRSNIKSQLAAPATIGIAETKVEDALVFPNPAHDIIEIISPFSGGKNRLEIFDAAGKLVKITEMNSLKQKVDISEFSGGLYFFRITDSGLTRARGKFLVN